MHIDWQWFSQFNMHTVLLKRWLIQIVLFTISISVVFLTQKWLGIWQRSDRNDPNNQDRKLITGYLYSLSLFITLLLICILPYFSINLIKSISLDQFSLLEVGQNTITTALPTLFLQLALIISAISIKGVICSSKFVHLLFGILLSITVSRSWAIIAQAITSPDSNVIEPVIGSDIVFSMVRYPAIKYIISILTIYLLFTIACAFLSHLLRSDNFSNWSASFLTRKQKILLKPLLFSLLVSLSAFTWISRYEFLWSSKGLLPGAGWVDVNINLPLRSILSIIILIISFIYLIKINRKLKKFILKLAFTASIISILAEALLSPFIQWIVVKPREYKLEKKYIEESIVSTRRAFQLDSITTRLINPKEQISKKDLVLGASTLKNVRLWDSQPLLATNRQLQQFKVYYKFSNASVDRYRLKLDSNDLQQVIISARELDQQSLPSQSRTWLNRHFIFTHGYGFTLSPVNTKAQDGLPDYFISDLGTSSKVEGSSELAISKEEVKEAVPVGRAGIYFGILPSPYAIAPTKLEEFDYPIGDQNVYNHYSGRAGIRLDSFINRIASAVFLLDPRLLNTGVLTKDSKLIIRRDIQSRIKEIAPFLQIDSEPYLISVNLKNNPDQAANSQNLFWVIEGYTSSNTYPYSASLNKYNEIRYIRNSVKIVLDAYNGNLSFYISEPDDPIIQAWKNIFPELFQGIKEIPIPIKEHLKVPTRLFKIQVQQLLRYHVTDPKTFYTGDDLWQVPKELYGKEQIPVEPYHITAQLQDSNSTEFLLLQPLTPLARPNLSAWLAARSDGKNYGELVLLRFPSQTNIFGPEQIQALINQNPLISQQFSLWDRAGSEVIQGNLLVLPLGKSLLYVEPVYLKSTRSGLPTLTRVVVSDGKRVAMAETLSEALNKLVD